MMEPRAATIPPSICVVASVTKTDSPATRRATGELTGDGSIDDSMTRKEAGISLRQMLFDGFDVQQQRGPGPMPLPRPSVSP